MKKPRNTRSVSSKRVYEWRAPGAPIDQPAEIYWSVTTLIKGGLPSPALTYWAAKATAEFAVANHRQVTAMLEAVKLAKDEQGFLRVRDPDAVQSAIDWLKGSPWRERDRKGNVGTAVHAAAESYVLGKPMPTVVEEARPYVAQFEQFLADWNPHYELAEASVYNRTLKYAGTLDAIATIDGLNVTPTRKNNGSVPIPDVNPHNERMDPLSESR